MKLRRKIPTHRRPEQPQPAPRLVPDVFPRLRAWLGAVRYNRQRREIGLSALHEAALAVSALTLGVAIQGIIVTPEGSETRQAAGQCVPPHATAIIGVSGSVAEAMFTCASPFEVLLGPGLLNLAAVYRLGISSRELAKAVRQAERIVCYWMEAIDEVAVTLGDRRHLTGAQLEDIVGRYVDAVAGKPVEAS